MMERVRPEGSENLPAVKEFDPSNPDEKVLFWARVTLENYMKIGQFHNNMWEQLNK